MTGAAPRRASLVKQSQIKRIKKVKQRLRISPRLSQVKNAGESLKITKHKRLLKRWKLLKAKRSRNRT